MGHRALVAYERTDGQYTLHYSHWGAANLKLKHRISAESPFGGDDTNSKWAKQLLAELADGLEADAVDGYLADEDRPSTVVEPKPRATGLTLDEIIADHLDYLHHEAFYVVSPTFEVTAYRTLWFGLQYDSETIDNGETVGNGALATVRWHDGEPVGDGHLKGQFRALKDVVGDMVDKGVFTPSTARQYLKQKLGEWVGERQELRIPGGESPSKTASVDRL
ncbi:MULTISPECIES: DUF6735 family protein [Halobacteriales]|jgi:hypothetical protein|uniref:Uncharacterized protein n=5 Tax=Halobacteriales TaxID=2235 RepID=A0A5N5U6W4_9EURY|nr:MULTISPECIES: DUF6735 family protein [Halobacteria]AAV44673.1 unknown [Haloarcula marismortui ATCC 43049]EMA27518.1 hypothetical protein C444_18547 [Haloarcula japonica DSM 6131]KAB7513631.1 hypothetical protein DMP03_11945 [Halosegnis rubeus]QZY04745.1 hypothetical protein K6T36_18585 [Halobaculum roseum]